MVELIVGGWVLWFLFIVVACGVCWALDTTTPEEREAEADRIREEGRARAEAREREIAKSLRRQL